MHPIASFMPPASTEHGTLHDLMSARAWGNHIIWRAGVSAVAIHRCVSLKEPSGFVPDHRGRSFRVAERYNWLNGRNAIDLAARSDTCRDSHRQHDRNLVPHLRNGYGDRWTYQPNGDDGHRILRTLSSSARYHLHFLSTRRGGNRREPPSRISGQKIRVRNPQRWLLDRSKWRGHRLASSLDRVYLHVHSSVSLFFHPLNIPLDRRFIPGSWLTELDWIPVEPSCLAQDMGRCLSDSWPV